ncbi:aldolase [Bacillus sp. SA1-12]|uniref:aldolase n=1 Tax=Bacillus sp. SA1-12 TaxID=1455638 RepID=UPI0006268895|nr:aldolase [Bacillus sp. SA1-12]KKI91422.1 aldolase [Bacillus sp. SA1-12]
MNTFITNKKRYNAFGLNVLSDIQLPELPLSVDKGNREDILIQQEDLTGLWNEIGENKKYFVVKEDIIMFQLPNKTIFKIQNGTEIYYSPIEDINEDHIRLYLLGTCMGALLMQRKILPLHGSAIEINGKAYAIVGDSGAGKSTLASALINKGYRLISDDVIPVTLNKEMIPMVTPAYPQQKLWLESLNHFGMESNDYRPIFDRETKFAIPVTDHFVSTPLPLAGVFELVKTEGNEVELQSIQNLFRLHTLYKHTYRNFFIAPAGLMDWHFNLTAKICEHIDIFQLCRPLSRFTVQDVTNLMLTRITKGE